MRLLIVATIIAVCSYIFDAWILVLPATSVLIFLLSLPCFAVGAIVACYRKYRRPALNVMACTGVFILGVVAVGGTLHIRKCGLEQRAVKLGDACLAYRAKYNHYPERLDQLVPEYVSSIPPASYGLLGNEEFVYAPHETSQPFIYYQCVPPFGHYYYIESRCWAFLD